MSWRPHPTRRRSLARRMIAATLAVVVVAVLLGACGGTGRPAAKAGGTHGAGNSTASEAIAFARCMRSHGVQHYPDPSSSGGFAKPQLTPQRLAVSASVIRAAGHACQHLFPNDNQSSQAQTEKVMTALWKFARCLRADGVPHWPDPLAESDVGQPNTPGFPRSMPGVDQNAPQVRTATRRCQHLLAGIGYASGGYP